MQTRRFKPTSPLGQQLTEQARRLRKEAQGTPPAARRCRSNLAAFSGEGVLFIANHIGINHQIASSRTKTARNSCARAPGPSNLSGAEAVSPDQRHRGLKGRRLPGPVGGPRRRDLSSSAELTNCGRTPGERCKLGHLGKEWPWPSR
jgi:hypothetical protein